MELKDEAYMGDGVYAGHDGYQLWTYTSNGITKDNQTAFDPTTFQAFLKYGERIFDLTITVKKNET